MKNGGSVFPQIHTETGDYGAILYVMENPGLTIRDFFAAQALAGLIPTQTEIVSLTGKSRPQLYAEAAYQIADAMIAEREAR